MLQLGPIIFGFIIGFIIGTRMNTNSENAIKLHTSSFLILLVIALLIAWQLGPFPYYHDLPINTAFFAGAIGLIVGKVILGK